MTEPRKFTPEEEIAYLRRDLNEAQETISMLVSYLAVSHALDIPAFWEWRGKSEAVLYAAREPTLAHESLHMLEMAENLIEHLDHDGRAIV